MALAPFFPSVGGYTRDPFGMDVSRVVDRALNDFFSDRPFGSLGMGLAPRSSDLTIAPWASLGGSWPADIVELDDRFEVHVDAPGFTPAEINVQEQEGVLTISGQKVETKEDTPKGPGQMWRRERTERRFTRSFAVPATAQADKITADLDKGVLTVCVPKMPEATRRAAEPKRIAVGQGATTSGTAAVTTGKA